MEIIFDPRDNYCTSLNSMGVNAVVSDTHRKEEVSSAGRFGIYNSVGLIDINGSSIQWVNIRSDTRGGPNGSSPTRQEQLAFRLYYGVPDTRIGDHVPIIKMKSVRKKSFPVLGRVTEVYWKGNDGKLGIVESLNRVRPISEMLMNTSLDVRVSVNKFLQCWVLSDNRINVPPSLMWGCYESIAEILLAAPIPER